jgi:hypothetical protein
MTPEPRTPSPDAPRPNPLAPRPGDTTGIPRRMRKLIGVVVMLIFVVVYAMVVQAIAVAILPASQWLTQAIFYVVGGLAWVVPLLPLIKWMEGGPDPTRPPARDGAHRS